MPKSHTYCSPRVFCSIEVNGFPYVFFHEASQFKFKVHINNKQITCSFGTISIGSEWEASVILWADYIPLMRK